MRLRGSIDVVVLSCVLCAGCGATLRPATVPEAPSDPTVTSPEPVATAAAPDELPAVIDLELGLARVRALVAQGIPGRTRVRDRALEQWLAAVIAEVRRTTGKGQLPFEPGQPRVSNSSSRTTYTGRDGEIIDGDLAVGSVRIGSLKRALVLVDGDASIGFVRDSIVVATGRVHAAFVDDSVVIAAGGIEVSHAGRHYSEGRGGLPPVLLSGTTLRGGAHGSVLAAPDGSDVRPEQTCVFVSSPAMGLLDGGPIQLANERLVLTHSVPSPQTADLEAAVGPGRIPRVCFYRRGESAPIACGTEGKVLQEGLPGWEIAFSSPRLITLAMGDQRIRLVPGRPSLDLAPERMRFPAGAEVHLVGVYEAPLPIGRVKVEVLRRGAPIVLVLMSHEAVDWAVERGEGVEIAGIVLTGYELSRVHGLPPAVPVVTRIHALGERAFNTHERTGESWALVVQGLADVFGHGVSTSGFLGAELGPERFTIR